MSRDLEVSWLISRENEEKNQNPFWVRPECRFRRKLWNVVDLHTQSPVGDLADVER